MTKYDLLYQDWLTAKKAKNYDEADRIRTEFERLHGLTIIKEGDMPIENVTVKRMKASAWEKKYGNPEVARHLEDIDSQVRYHDSNYHGIPARGMVYEKA